VFQKSLWLKTTHRLKPTIRDRQQEKSAIPAHLAKVQLVKVAAE
jgi:hypothetical protein